jgi:O-phosphoseryl-tRNA(Cys) synthetase
MLHGLGIDESSKRSLESIEGLLVKAAQANKCAVLLVHNIQRTDINMQLPLWKLKRIIEKAKELDLKFYTVSEISK